MWKGGVGARTPPPMLGHSFGYTWFKTVSISVLSDAVGSTCWVTKKTYLLLTSASLPNPSRTSGFIREREQKEVGRKWYLLLLLVIVHTSW